MSLFGTSPDDPAANSSTNSFSQSKPLFGEEDTTGANSTASLFADENTDASPWAMPTPKKSARNELVKNLLPATDVPDSYIDAYDVLLDSDVATAAGVSLTGVKNILESSNISSGDQSAILNLVVPGGQDTSNGIGRNEFNVLLALIGLAQEGDDISLDGVDDRRRSEATLHENKMVV